MKEYRNYLLEVLEDVSHEEGEIVPDGFRNNIRWNVGHLFLDQYLWLEAITREEANYQKQFNDWFGFGTTPANFTDETPTLEELKDLLKRQIEHIKEVYGHRLEEEFPPTSMENYTTIEQVLIRTIFHEGMHIQAVIDIIKCIPR